MAENKHYTELEVWKKARQLVKEIYTITRTFPAEELYTLTSQMRRAAISIPSNVAEGIGRKTNKETLQFLNISKGSIYELETQLYLSFDLGFISIEKLNSQLFLIEECRRLLFGFINYYKTKSSQE
jgi:four helix bundle protein